MPEEADTIETILMEDEIYLSQNYTNLTSDSENVCKFTEVNSMNEFVNLFRDSNCYKHSVGFTAFLCVANFLILVCGLLGNAMVIYVVTMKIKKKTASSWFILNLAVADLLVILCCIPATLVSNIFRPWILGDTMCKVVAYAQGVSVFCSVYSLVAISFDRCRAIHQSNGLTPNISTSKTIKIILLIWLVGLIITLPWAFVFELATIVTNGSQQENLPFCHETWGTKSHEIIYFFLIHVFACFTLPLGLIVACNIVIWKGVLDPKNSTVSSASSLLTNSLTTIHRNRKIRVLRMFTCLTFVFFVCWLPLYLIMARVKLFHDGNFTGLSWEKKILVSLIPIAQLLGSCNSCVNPILYALLNQTFRESFKSIFVCPIFCFNSSPTVSVLSRGNNSMVAAVRSGLGHMDTPV